MQITPPFGYGEIVPLEKHHRVLLPASGNAGTVPDFAKRINAMAISFSEFAIAQRDYPIVFATADSGKSYAPVAVLGLADGQNLFIDDHERWAEGAYVPAFVRRYPFCISRIFKDGVAQDERLVCVEKSYVDAGGIAMFNADGLPTEAWAERATVRGWQKKYDAAIADWRQAISLDPTSSEFHVGLARVLAWKGDRTAALAEIDRALLITPRDPALWELKGDFARDEHNRALALTSYREADRLDQGSRAHRIGDVPWDATAWRIDATGVRDNYSNDRGNESAFVAAVAFVPCPTAIQNLRALAGPIFRTCLCVASRK